MDNLPFPEVDQENRKSVLKKIWGILNSDIGELLGRNRAKDEGDADSMTPAPVNAPEEPEILSEVDLRKIDLLQFRRSVIDWRDKFHVNVTEVAVQVSRSLSRQVDSELANLNFLRRRVFKKKAIEVLGEHIERYARSPMRRIILDEQAGLRRQLLAWIPNSQELGKITLMWPKNEWENRLNIDFSAGNRDEILEVLGELLLGANGVADRHRQWATQYATKIMEMKHAQSGSL